jgi:hypothetical protein
MGSESESKPAVTRERWQRLRAVAPSIELGLELWFLWSSLLSIMLEGFGEGVIDPTVSDSAVGRQGGRGAAEPRLNTKQPTSRVARTPSKMEATSRACII